VCRPARVRPNSPCRRAGTLQWYRWYVACIMTHDIIKSILVFAIVGNVSSPAVVYKTPSRTTPGRRSQ